MRKQTIPMLVAYLAAMLAMVASSPALAQGEPKSNQFWWPESLSLNPLRDHGVESNPMGDDFNYAEAFASLDLAAVKSDIDSVLKTSQDWWPLTTVTTDRFSFVWPGTAREPTAYPTAVVAPVVVNSVSSR